MKICTKCKRGKPFNNFYKDRKVKNGLYAKCKECHRKVCMDYMNNNPIKHKKYLSIYRKSARYLAIQAEKERIDREKFPQHHRARRIAFNAIRTGKLLRCPCEICGIIEVEAHHDDYTKPLMVRWLCVKHHKEFHRNLKNKK